MRKTPLLITLSVIAAIAVIAYFLSQRTNNQAKDQWDLLPPTSLAVFEVNEFAAIEKLKMDSSGMLGFFSTKEGAPLTTRQPLCAFQSSGKKIDLLTLLTVSDTANFERWLGSLQKFGKAAMKKRTYEGIDIYDLSARNGAWLSIARIGSVWIAATHSILVEEVIRQNRNEDRSTFHSGNRSLFRLSSLKNDAGNIYLNWPRFSMILKPTPIGNHEVDYMKWMCQSALFDFRWSGETLLLNGFATDTTKDQTTLLSLFKDQTPVPLGLKSVIPEQFRFLAHFGMSNPSTWFQSRMKLSNRLRPALAGDLETLRQKYGFNMAEFIRGIDDEIAFFTLQQGEEILIVELKEITRTVAQLNKLNVALGKLGQHDQERYTSQTIHVLKYPGLSTHLFWPLGFTSPEIFYTVVNNHLIFSSSAKGMKRMIDNMDTESTLKKSLQWGKFFESALQEANVSFVANPGLPGIKSSSENLVTLLESMNSLKKFSLQFYALEGDYYANAVLEFGGPPRQESVVAAKPSGKNFDLDQTISSPPWLVRNAVDKTFEILIQDSTQHLQLLSRDGRILWRLDVRGPIVDPVEQIDFYKNGKLQYLFVTPGYLHVVDRLGKYLPSFPQKVSMEAIAGMSLIDYDKSRNYRVLMADNNGKIIVNDLKGQSLEGWDPKVLERNFVATPRHYRIQQKDYYAALTTTGELNLLNRRGEQAKGFPKKLPSKPAPGMFADGIAVVTVSELGQLWRIDTRGQVVGEESLLKNTKDAKFQLVPSRDGSTFLVTRMEQGKLTAFDPNGKERFTIENPASENLSMKFFHFNSDKSALLVFDPEQKLFYAVDGAGKLITPQPYASSSMPGVQLESEGRIITFFVPDKRRLRLISVAF